MDIAEGKAGCCAASTGTDAAEIAERMGKDLRTVQTFLPYSRGQYGQEETDDSVKSKKYRERMNAAAERMTLKEEAVAKNDLAVYKRLL